MTISNLFVLSGLQIEAVVHAPYNPSSNEAVCLEILGNLRRCLGQQADVRLLLYQVIQINYIQGLKLWILFKGVLFMTPP